MPLTRSKPEVFREMIFGFLLTTELLKGRPDYTQLMADCPSGEDREVYEDQLFAAIAIAMSVNILHLWNRASYEVTPSGVVIGLTNNRESTVTPPAELIKRIQEFLELEVEPRWYNA